MLDESLRATISLPNTEHQHRCGFSTVLSLRSPPSGDLCLCVGRMMATRRKEQRRATVCRVPVVCQPCQVCAFDPVAFANRHINALTIFHSKSERLLPIRFIRVNGPHHFCSSRLHAWGVCCETNCRIKLAHPFPKSQHGRWTHHARRNTERVFIVKE